MALERKPKQATAEYQTDKKTVEQIVSLLAGFLLLAALSNALLNFVENLGLGDPNSLWARLVEYFLEHIWPVWKLVAVIASILAFFGIIYNSWKLAGINAAENLIFNPHLGALATGGVEISEPKNKKWEQVIKYANSDNPSDWRQAVIEADVMLEELLHNLGYDGASVCEMLKSVDEKEFLTVEDAWQAHKVRNAIAHSGGDFELSERETKRVIGLFEKVFTEFEVI